MHTSTHPFPPHTTHTHTTTTTHHLTHQPKPYPEADATWLDYLRSIKGLVPTVATDANLCTLLQDDRVRNSVAGLIVYEEATTTINAMTYLAATAAGLHSGIPVTSELVEQNPCLNDMPTVYTLPPAAQFASDIDAYTWGIYTFLKVRCSGLHRIFHLSKLSGFTMVLGLKTALRVIKEHASHISIL
jgi:hypothetical protein